MKKTTVIVMLLLISVGLGNRKRYDFVSTNLIAHYKLNENAADDNAELVVNGDFALWDSEGDRVGDPTGWIVTGESGNDPEVEEVDSGQAHGDTKTTGGFCNIYTSGNYVAIEQTLILIVGRKYRLSVNIDIITVGNLSVADATYAMFTTGSISSTGTTTLTFVATNTAPLLQIKRASGATDITFGDVSIRLCAVEDSSGNDHDGVAQQATDQIHQAGKINGAFDFNGSSDYIEIADISSDVKSIAIWCNPDAVDVTDYLIDLNGTDYITIVSGTVIKNGFATGTQIIYVGGIVASTVTANWHLIVLTSTVGFTADDLDIGQVGGVGYFDGLIDNVMIFNIELSAEQVKQIYNAGRGTEYLDERMPRSRYNF